MTMDDAKNVTWHMTNPIERDLRKLGADAIKTPLCLTICGMEDMDPTNDNLVGWHEASKVTCALCEAALADFMKHGGTLPPPLPPR